MECLFVFALMVFVVAVLNFVTELPSMISESRRNNKFHRLVAEGRRLRNLERR